MDGAATAAGFYLGIVDDVSPKLKKLRREYTAFIGDILASNAKVKKSIDVSKRLMQQSAVAQANGSAFQNPVAQPVKQKFQLNLEPKRGLGLIRKLFPSAREYMQKFVGRLIPLAKGGMVKDPTAALIGEGGQPEAVIPLNKMQGFFSRTLSKAITDAGKATGAAKGGFGKASSIRDIIVGFTKGEKQLRAMVKYIEEGVATGRTAAQDAHRMAVVVAKMREDEFESAIEKANFVKMLKGQLVPAVEKMRKNAGAMRDIFNKNDDIIQQQKDNAAQVGLMLTAALHNLERGFDAGERLVGALSSAEAGKKMMQSGGLDRAGVKDARVAFSKISDAIVSSVDLEQVAAGFADAGVRGKSLVQLTENYGRSISMLRDARGVDEAKTAALNYQMHDRLGMTVKSVNDYNAAVSTLAASNAIAADTLIDSAMETKPLMQGVFRDIGTSAQQSLLTSLTSAKAAFSERFADFDMNALVGKLATDTSTRALVGAQIGMSEGDVTAALRAGNIDAIVPGILGVIKSDLAGKSGPALQAAADVLNTKFGDALGGMPIEQLTALSTEADAITLKFRENQLVMKDAVKSTDALAESAKSTLGPLGLIKNELLNLADKSGLKSVVATVQELDIIGIGQGVLGLGMAVGGFTGVIGRLLPGLAGLLAKLPLVGVLFKGAAKETGEAVGSIGKGVGETISRVGTGIGSFIGTVGKGIGTAITGILQGLGAGLLALAPALAALAAPPVLIGIAAVSVALLALGASIWMIGKGLGAAAPFIKATLEGVATAFTAFLPIMQTFADIIMAQAKGIALILDTVIRGIADSVVQLVTTFSTVDATNLIAVGAGLAAVGVGFASFGAGLAAGLVALTAGNLVDKIGSLFGLSAGTGVIGALRELTGQVSPLASAFTQLSRLPSVITLPELSVPKSYPTEVMSATMRAVPNLRAAAEDARYLQQSVDTGNSEVADLLRAAVALLNQIASNGKPRPGGIAGALVSGGVG